MLDGRFLLAAVQLEVGGGELHFLAPVRVVVARPPRSRPPVPRRSRHLRLGTYADVYFSRGPRKVNLMQLREPLDSLSRRDPLRRPVVEQQGERGGEPVPLAPVDGVQPFDGLGLG